MSRRISEDAEALIEFFDGYNLTGFKSSKQRIDNCRALHRKLFAVMVFRNEIDNFNLNGIDKFQLFMDEAISDLMLSVFSWAQGAYKSAKLHLRCAIECTIRALLSINNGHEIYEEKRVFSLFDYAREDCHFSLSLGLRVLDSFKSTYGELCEVVHSIQGDQSRISSIGLLPKLSHSESLCYTRLFSTIVNDILTLFYLNFYDQIHKMHPENQQDFLEAMSKSSKRQIADCLFACKN